MNIPPSSPSLPTVVADGDVVAEKARWRALVRAARRELVDAWGATGREEAAEALAATGLELVGAGTTVTLFEPMRTEPPVDRLVRELIGAGVRVLVPITLARPRLDWADVADPDRTPLGEEALAQVDLALVPALAVGADGVRLGQGGGYYDTTLPLLRERSPGAAVVAVLHDHELVPAVPADPHDARVDAVLRPGSGVTRLPLSPAERA
ncbi:5-formyltetrahydrofolate cyclo-ligase [Ornithinimicrobium sp. W1665]|uniref:5-formyltetrahydrofolate cyclo-ligase n=2 Tax=Ornithinimicrobium sp. W1665 TaxID=3416666 RepID=UPI003CF20E5A